MLARFLSLAQIRSVSVAKYRCFFFGEKEQVTGLTLFRSADALDARREILTHLCETKYFDGYELWEDGRIVDRYRPNRRSASLRP